MRTQLTAAREEIDQLRQRVQELEKQRDELNRSANLTKRLCIEMKEYNEQAVETLDDAGCIIANKNIIIDNLQARIAELEAENARLNSSPTIEACRQMIRDKAVIEASTLHEQLAAEQLNNKRLRDALEFLNARIVTMDLGGVVERALSIPASTEALDKYVEEKVKEARPDFRQMREMLRAMQAGELTVSRGIEILDMWHAGNWNDNMLPPVRQDLIEEDSMPVEIIDRCNQQISTLTRQRDLAVEALEKWDMFFGGDAETAVLTIAEDPSTLTGCQKATKEAMSAIKESEAK